MKHVAFIILLFTTSLVARADFKSDFKKGCQSVQGNSFVDDADGSFSCNLKSGDTIRCTDPDGKTPCRFNPTRISNTTLLNILKTGGFKIAASKPTRPEPVPVNHPADSPPR